MFKPIILTSAILFFYGNLFAQHHSDNDTHHSKHHIALFNGLTTNVDHETTGYSLGIDYEYFISDAIGIGFIGEYVFSGEGEFILGIPVFFHPIGGLKFGVAPIGVSAEVHHDDHGDDSHGKSYYDVEKEWNMGVRLNSSYNVHLGKLSVGPSISLDITNTTAFVYGFTIGVGF